MLFYPPCKVNLGLQVLNKRSDGYHNIDTVMMKVNLCDILEVLPADSFSFSTSGIEIGTEDNLCLKAYRLFQKTTQIERHFKLHLHKQIPIGAGLGGGSSDAAYTLIALNILNNNALSQIELEQLALELGSDCPFFLRNNLQHCTGRGEMMEPLSLPFSGCWVALFYPNCTISTAEAYQKCTPKSHLESTKELTLQPISTWKDELINDFEASIFELYPTFKKIKKELYKAGAFYASLSGSGSTVYGLFKEKPALPELRKRYPMSWLVQV